MQPTPCLNKWDGDVISLISQSKIIEEMETILNTWNLFSPFFTNYGMDGILTKVPKKIAWIAKNGASLKPSEEI